MDTVLGTVLRGCGVTRERVVAALRICESAPVAGLGEADAEALAAIGIEHLLLGLVRGGDPVVVDALAACGASYDGPRDAVRAAVQHAG